LYKPTLHAEKVRLEHSEFLKNQSRYTETLIKEVLDKEIELKPYRLQAKVL